MRIIRNILIVMVVLILPSCDFLDNAPTTYLVKDNVYEDEGTAQSALFGCYKTLFDLSHNSIIFYVHGASILRGYGKTPQLSWFDHTVYSNHNSNELAYQKIFGAIAKINTFIDAIESSPLPDKFIRQCVAEARFLRAWFYFTAVRFWGDVPYFLHQPKTVEEASIPRTPYQQVYKYILDDLIFAEGNIVDFEELGVQGRQDGRVCKYAATALKAKVWLQIACLMESPKDQWFDVAKDGRYPDFTICGVAKDDVKAAYTNALEAAELVMNEGPYDLEPDYANLFRFDPVAHPEDYLSLERILVIPITPQVQYCTYSSWSLPKQPWGAKDYTADNGNKQSILGCRFTWETWCNRYGTDADYVEKEQDEIGVYHYYSGCADPRLDATYAHTTYYTGGASATTPTTNHNYPYCIGNTSGKNTVALWPKANLTGANDLLNVSPFYKKGFSSAYAGSQTGGNADIYLMRYADVILTAAEASAGLCDTPRDQYGQKAVMYVNKILKRARQSTNKSETYPHVYDGVSEAASPKDWSVDSFIDREELINTIIWEKVFEQDYEFHSFFETRKRGANWYVRNFVKPYNAFMKESANIRLHDSGINKGLDREEDIEKVRCGLLIAYPERELRYNTELGYRAQNDFYIE